MDKPNNTDTRIEESYTDSGTVKSKKPYVKPCIISAEPLELVANACDPDQAGVGKLGAGCTGDPPFTVGS